MRYCFLKCFYFETINSTQNILWIRWITYPDVNRFIVKSLTYYPKIIRLASLRPDFSLCCYLVSGLEHVLCVQDKTCKFFLPLSVITQVINLLNGIWRHHVLSNKVGQNSCPLSLDNNHSKFSVICVRFIYKYWELCYFFIFIIRRRLSFLKTFLGKRKLRFPFRRPYRHKICDKDEDLTTVKGKHCQRRVLECSHS